MTQLSYKDKDWLVKRAEAVVDHLFQKSDDKRLGSKENKSQFRNMVQIVQTEVSIPVLANFIHYQSARDATKNVWGHIAEKVTGDLEDLAKNFPLPDEGVAAGQLARRHHAIKLYFGYMARHYYYRAEASKPPKQNNGRGDHRQDRHQNRQRGRR